MVTPVFAKENEVVSGQLYFDSALESLENKKYVDALKSFNEAIKREPDNIEYYYQRGAMRYKAFKDYPGAITDFKKVIQLNPDYSGIYSELAYVSLFDNNVPAMRAYLDLATQKNPNDARIYTTWALSKIAKLQYESAIKDYDKAIELDPNNSNLYLRRGYAKSYVRRYKDAIKDYDKAIELDPNNSSAYEKRAEAHNVMLRTGRAKKDWIKSEQLRNSQ